MSHETQSQPVTLPRIALGIGFLLIFVAVGVGAATDGATELPKYLAGAAVVLIGIGAIGGLVMGRLRRSN
jgi:hypothetical protein